MNNQIAIRTNKGEYHPGEPVFGAVYLRICRPTEGCGIKITFNGTELCEYNYEHSGKKTISNKTVHVDFSDITLYSQEDCFQFGSYVFPFQFQLPNEIVGTTELNGGGDQCWWKIQVSYWIKVWVKESEAIQEVQPVVIYQCQKLKLLESSMGSAKASTFEIKRFGILSNMVHVTAKLVDNYISSGSNAQLKLILTNDSKLNLTSINIQLKRYLRLVFQSIVCDTNSLTSVMKVDGNSVEIVPESGSHLIQSFGGRSESTMFKIISGGLDNLQIPLVERLKNGDKINLPPSAESKSFKINYGIDISVSFSNGHTETLCLVIPGVLPQPNKKWNEWKAADWMFGCETKFSNSLFSAGQHLLNTEAFSSLPSFQVL